MKKVSALALALVMILCLAACGGTQSSTPAPADGTSAPASQAEAAGGAALGEGTKIAMLLSGPITDGGWNTNAYEALMEAQDKYGVEVGFTENVAQNDQVSLLRQYATKRYNFIVCHGFQYADAITQVSAEFPDIMFWNYGGTVTGDNLASSQYKMGETGYPIGALIGLSTETNKVGFVVGSEDPTTMSELKNMEAGAQLHAPDVECAYTFTGNWNDIQKAKEAAYAHIANGCDVIVSCVDAGTIGVIEACKEKGVAFVVVTNDSYDEAPDLILTSAVHDAKAGMGKVIETFVEGKFEGKQFFFGIEDGVMHVGRFGDKVTQEQEDEVEDLVQQVVDGKIELISLT